MFRCLTRACCVLASLVGVADAQNLVRVPASSLRLSATPPPTTYATARAFPSVSFTQPVAIVAPPGDARRLFVVEKPGRIHVIPDVTAATPTRSLFLDLTASVAASADLNDERGLLALAFHPNFASNGQFFVWYTVNTTTGAGTGLHNRLSRFRVSADPNVANPASEEPLISQRDEANNHNGGELLFGPDGYLYLSLGDEGGGNDQFQNSQRIDRDLFAGIIRIDVDRRPGSLAPNAHPAVHAGSYAIPPDNPFVGATSFNGAAINPAAVRTEFWATGLRNPWRMSFDPATGRLWCADVGQSAREEINLITRGANYGWNHREGNLAGPRTDPPAAASFTSPIWEYGRSEGASVTGGLVYRGERYPGLVGHYLFADFVSGRIWALQPDDDRPVGASRVQLLATDATISSSGLDPATGDILLADLQEGVLKRLVATTASGTPLPATLSATGAFSNVATLTPAPGVVAYEPNVSFWSDHAQKRRWFALPDSTSRFGFSADGPWSLPTGAVWIKHFDLELTRGNPATTRRLETRFLVKTSTGMYGLTYRWNEAQTEASLVPEEGAAENITVVENGAPRTQTWHYPSRAECMMCHTTAGGHALTFNTRQLNRDFAFPGGRSNIIAALAQAGYLDVASVPAPAALPALVSPEDASQPLESRARAYLDVNCSQCHQLGGTALGRWDARSSLPLPLTNLINGLLIDNAGDAANRLLVPGDPAHSRVLARMSTRGPGQMPPIATHDRDLAGEDLIRRWILALGQPASPQPSTRIVNLSARAQTGAGADALITGFVISPGGEKTVIIRGVGPTLGTAPFNVAGALADPTLTLYGPDSTSRVAATNDNWLPADAAAFARVAAFPLPVASRDAAIVATLPPGAYTAQVTAPGGGAGIALIEVYEADPPGTTSTARLTNTSVRARVGVGGDVLIPGLVVAAGSPKSVLLRAVGPALSAAPFNVSGTLAEPILTLYVGSERVATNRAWNSAPNLVEIRAATRAVGAFPLPEGSRDSVLLLTLPAGAYTVQVSGANDTSGVALVEVYELP